MKKTIVILLALLLIVSLLPAAMAKEDRFERLKALKETPKHAKVLTSSARLGKATAERQRVAEFRKAQAEKLQALPREVSVADKPKKTEVTAPVGSKERRDQLLKAKEERIKAARERRLASAGTSGY